MGSQQQTRCCKFAAVGLTGLPLWRAGDVDSAEQKLITSVFLSELSKKIKNEHGVYVGIHVTITDFNRKECCNTFKNPVTMHSKSRMEEKRQLCLFHCVKCTNP